MGINITIQTGYLCEKPEIKATAAGATVMTLRLGVKESWKDKDNEWQERWHNFDWVFFGQHYERVAALANKGDLVTIQGRPQVNSWMGSDGQKRYKVQFKGDSIQLPKQPSNDEYYGTKNRSDKGSGTQTLGEVLTNVGLG